MFCDVLTAKSEKVQKYTSLLQLFKIMVDVLHVVSRGFKIIRLFQVHDRDSLCAPALIVDDHKSKQGAVLLMKIAIVWCHECAAHSNADKKSVEMVYKLPAGPESSFLTLFCSSSKNYSTTAHDSWAPLFFQEQRTSTRSCSLFLSFLGQNFTLLFPQPYITLYYTASLRRNSFWY